MIDVFCESELSDFIPQWFYPAPIQMLVLHAQSNSSEIPAILKNYDLLITADNLDIRKAWKAVDKRFEQIKGRPHDFYVAGPFEGMFPFLMVMTLCKSAIDPGKRSFLTPADRKKLLSELRDTADKFIKLLDRVDLDSPTASLLARSVGIEDYQLRYPSDAKSSIPEYFFSPVSNVIRRLIADAECWLNPKTMIVKRPGVEDVKKLHFCRMLARLFRVWLYSPLYAAVAAFATVLLNEDVDAEYVRFAEKGYMMGE